ncbi:MAG: glycosyltransferase [Armatimonadota bacterium]|nr:glycosyltransferase [Armatimonadota bacterium]
MIHVLHVIESLGIGGAERQLVSTLLRSDRHRFAHTVCALTVVEHFGDVLAGAGIPVIVLNRRPRRETWRTLRELRAVIRSVRPQIVHTSLYWSDVLGRTAARMEHVPSITTMVNTIYSPEWRRDNPRLTPRKIAMARVLDLATARWSACVVAVTGAVRACGIKYLGVPPHRIVVIPRGLELGRLTPPPAEQTDALRASLGWAGAHPVMLNVGRLVPQKGQRYAVAAMPRVLERYPRARLAIAGEGPLRTELEEIARAAGVGDHVQFLGERTDVPALLAAADLFVFSSLFEGFAGALVEAMAMGKPTVTAAFAGADELTDGGRTARLVPTADADALAAGVIELAGNPAEAASLGEAAESWARSRFDLRRTAAALEALYERVASGRPVVGDDLWATGARVGNAMERIARPLPEREHGS